LIGILFISSISSAQNKESPPISPDRPGVGTPPSLVPNRLFQIETGFLYAQKEDDVTRYKTLSYGQLLLRYGVFSVAELRLETDYTQAKTDSSSARNSVIGLGAIRLGSKMALYGGKGIVPQISFLGNLTLPYFGKQELKPSKIAPSMYLLMQNSLAENLSLGYDFGLEWYGDNSSPAVFYAISLGRNFTDKFSCFAENYGYFFSGSSRLYADGGFAYLLRKNLQVDVYGGINLQGEKKYTHISAGIAWRLPR